MPYYFSILFSVNSRTPFEIPMHASIHPSHPHHPPSIDPSPTHPAIHPSIHATPTTHFPLIPLPHTQLSIHPTFCRMSTMSHGSPGIPPPLNLCSTREARQFTNYAEKVIHLWWGSLGHNGWHSRSGLEWFSGRMEAKDFRHVYWALQAGQSGNCKRFRHRWVGKTWDQSHGIHITEGLAQAGLGSGVMF